MQTLLTRVNDTITQNTTEHKKNTLQEYYLMLSAEPKNRKHSVSDDYDYDDDDDDDDDKIL
jgi:hypothetical protein